MLDSVKKKSISHLKIAHGQVEGIIKMIEKERYCIDISKQILSVQSLLKKANLEILQGHIKTCVADAVKKGKADAKIEEIFGIIEKYAKG